MISQFPDFTPINLNLKNEIQAFTRQFDPYEDFSFINLYTWNTNGKAAIAWLNGNLVIKIPHYMGLDKFTHTFIGNTYLDETAATLVKEFSKLELIPEFIIKQLRHPEMYAIAEDRDSFDYMYEVKSLANLEGRALKKKRNLYNTACKALGARVKFTSVNSLTPRLKKEIEHVINEWFKQTAQPDLDVKSERMALTRLLESFNELNLWVTLCYIDEALSGFSVHEIINEDFSICHFEKSFNHRFSGLNTLLIQAAAQFLSDKSSIVNWQQDLGIAGLKKAKRAYAPKYYLRKYSISHGSVG